MAQTIRLEVTDPVGLYLTPTNTLVTIANHYDSDIHLLYDKKSVNLKSMMAVISLGVPTKAILSIEADGEDEKQAIDQIKNTITSEDIGVLLYENND